MDDFPCATTLSQCGMYVIYCNSSPTCFIWIPFHYVQHVSELSVLPNSSSRTLGLPQQPTHSSVFSFCVYCTCWLGRASTYCGLRKKKVSRTEWTHVCFFPPVFSMQSPPIQLLWVAQPSQNPHTEFLRAAVVLSYESSGGYGFSDST